MTDAIRAEGLVKTFGDVRALDGLDLAAAEGTALGVLGPNGAGKTTAVRILTTLLRPDAGRVTVAGLDAVRQADEVRRLIGLSGQYAAVDEFLTARENLRIFGRLYQLDRRTARRRADELLETFDLTDVADRPAKTYSGGLRRRLDLAASLIVRPRVIFLDEPTTGLDPRSRIGVWETVRGLLREGSTLLLTTQYLEEADQLADRIVVIDHGRAIAEGTADQLKDKVGGERLEVVVRDEADLDTAARRLAELGDSAPVPDREARRLTVAVSSGTPVLAAAIRALDAEGVQVVDVGLRRPTLDDVFLAITGRGTDRESGPDEPAAALAGQERSTR
nr:ABC transporter [uncultured bacterium]